MKATIFLIIICIIAYPFGLKYDDLLSFSYTNFLDKNEWWTPVTAIFVHANLGHLLGNMLFLFLFGKALEHEIGPARLLLCFFTGGILSLLASYFIYPHSQAIVGASGAICTVIGLMMIFNPWKISFLLTFFPMPLGVAALTYLLMNFLLAYNSHRGQSSSGLHTAYELHILGFIIGILFGVLWNRDWKKNLLISIFLFIGFYILLGGIFHFL